MKRNNRLKNHLPRNITDMFQSPSLISPVSQFAKGLYKNDKHYLDPCLLIYVYLVPTKGDVPIPGTLIYVNLVSTKGECIPGRGVFAAERNSHDFPRISALDHIHFTKLVLVARL